MSDAQAPNVLLIHADQHRFDCVGANQPFCPAGPGRFAATPNLDRLAAGGTNFTHAFTPCAVCTPARASLITGTWPSVHGAWVIPGTQGYRPAEAGLPTLWRLAADAGYYVAHVGKVHGELAEGPEAHGAHAVVYEHAYTRWRRESGMADRPKGNGYWGDVDPHVDAESHRIGWGAREAAGQIRQAAEAGRRFFVRWDPSEPHLPNLPPADWLARVPADLPPWPSLPDDLAGKPAVQRTTRRRWGCDDWGWDRWLPIVRRYLAEVALLDHHVGRLLATLDELGLAGNTLVLYTADHGDMCGGHGMADKHYVGYDDILRVPMLARLPGRLPTGATCDRFVCHELDIARTLAGLFAEEVPGTFAGRDLLAEAAGEGEGRPDAFSQYAGTMQGRCDQRYLRTRRWKYVYGPTTGDELYDLEADPAELRNLVDDPDHAGPLQQVRERTEAWMAETNDRLAGPLWRWPARVRD